MDFLNEIVSVSTALVLDKNRGTNSTGVVAYGMTAKAMTPYLGRQLAIECVNAREVIEDIEATQTVAALSVSGGVDEAIQQKCRALRELNISPAYLTLAEVSAVHDFINNATEDSVTRKIEMITDLLSSIVHGKGKRRTYDEDYAKSLVVKSLLQKAIDYQNGTYNMSRGFEWQRYPGHHPLVAGLSSFDSIDSESSGHISSIYAGAYVDTMSRDEYRTLLANLTDEELLDGEYIEESDFYVYGPFTGRDMEAIEMFSRDTWARATNSRNRPRLESLLDDYILPRDSQIETDLTRRYISDIVLSTRRPNVKHLLALLASLGNQASVYFDDKEFIKNYRNSEIVKRARKSLQLCSYYAVRICLYPLADIKQVYKTSVPVTATFYDRLLETISQWSDQKLAKLDSDFAQYMVLLDTRLFEAEAAFMDMCSMLNRQAASETLVAIEARV